MARRQSESVLACGLVTAVQTCGRTAAVLVHRLGSAGSGGGGIFDFLTAMDQNYVILFVLVFNSSYIRPLFRLVSVEFVIVGQ
jgi:hypothetical protein